MNETIDIVITSDELRIILQNIERVNPIIPQSLSRSLVAYRVLISQGYVADGILVIPDNCGTDGILLHHEGIAYNQPILGSPVRIDLSFKNVNITNEVYPTTGMLVLSSPAYPEDTAILVGDDGKLYCITYDGTLFEEITPVVEYVLKSELYLSNGILLYKSGAVAGNAGLLFGIINSGGKVFGIELPE